MSTWSIYSLSDDSGVRYVGVSTRLHRRISDHIYRSQKGRSHKDAWLRKLKRDGLVPMVNILEQGDGDGWGLCEMKWIAHFKKAGCDLTNSTEGGEGCLGFRHSSSTKKIQSLLRVGRNLSDDHKEKISQSLFGRKKSPETIAKMKGRVCSDSTRKNMSDAQRGHAVSPETRHRISETKKGVPISEAAKRSRPKTLALSHRKAISQGNKRAWSEGKRK